LTTEQVKLLRAWIEQGATWPEVVEADLRRTHWAFQPVVRSRAPEAGAGWARNPVDQFIAARLAKEGLRPAAEADRATLIRRLSFDLLGLPPTPEEVDGFVRDESATAYERLVDRYLASPAYGERWARHWLDVVRFAETTGFETNAQRPNAWPYRDYVIRAFNGDKPYDEFIRDQLAGDAGGEDEATGYLVAGAYDQVKGDPALSAQQRADELNDMVSTTGGTFLGLTVGCARCHDHKFDPVSQVDYHRMKAVFSGVRHDERAVRPPGRDRREKEAAEVRVELAKVEARLAELEPRAGPGTTPLRVPVSARKNVERFEPVEAKFVRMTILRTAGGAEPCVDELEVFSGPHNVALAGQGARVTASGTLPGYDIHQLPFINDGRYGNSASWIGRERDRGWVQLELPRAVRIDRIVWSRDRLEGGFQDRVPTKYRFEVALAPGAWRTVASSDDRLPAGGVGSVPKVVRGPEAETLLQRQKGLEARLRALTTLPRVYAGRFAVPEPTYRLQRGDIKDPREAVAPGAPAAFGGRLQLPADTPEQQRRLALARWIADPRHPLTARVMVNRLWQHHFGAGIVRTPSDFGLNGARPTHPALLDWLADEFVAGGWRVKHIHRLIVLSCTYRQASTANPAGLARDADARLLWRYPPRRLEAEPLRDAILAVSGKLDRVMGGPGFDLFESRGNTPQGVKLYEPKKVFGPAEWRRMIYQSKPRMRLDDTFGAFDCPDAGQAAPRRTVSTTPLQVLNLLNSPFMLQQAGFFAQRLRQEASDPAGQVRRGYWLAYQRPPEAEEVTAALALVRAHGLRAFCLALFNTNEFLFVF
jgi:hypothetical protein